MEYVALGNPALAASWQYASLWGAADVEQLTLPDEPGVLDPAPGPSRCGSLADASGRSSPNGFCGACTGIGPLAVMEARAISRL